ncbi:MAG TPA: hypothetical protein PK867_12835 [Pirellulales bacterium]|nr:hypothetical protein [Pirellulales bacterium]
MSLLVAVILPLSGSPLAACPFCTTLGPTIAQQCDRAEVAFLGELVEADGASWKLRVYRIIKGLADGETKRTIAIATDIAPVASGNRAPRPGTLLLALGARRSATSPAKQSWTTIVLNEASYAYVAQSPPLKTPVAERLGYFVRSLEHADPLIAEDACLEFGHAPFDQIARLAGQLPIDRLRDWIDDDSVPPPRKGLYGLLLGLAAGEQGCPEIADDFWRWIGAPANDFRSGFDGILGGYLWVGQEAALRRLERRYLDRERAAIGDLRHLMTALRFYHDYGHGISAAELTKVYRRFLDRPALAAAAMAVLARWEDWASLERVTLLFGRPGYTDAATERALIGYLLACPLPEAHRQVARLRQLVPERVAEAERLELESDGKR